MRKWSSEWLSNYLGRGRWGLELRLDLSCCVKWSSDINSGVLPHIASIWVFYNYLCHKHPQNPRDIQQQTFIFILVGLQVGCGLADPSWAWLGQAGLQAPVGLGVSLYGFILGAHTERATAT